ncbi:MAG: DUF4595 domain-containing protein [Candidatus Amulumruptor caecigallinarius]|nr:DUF4595 domain-containing protein [Candidatus Amulumruptor caecigallinarius]MCM1396201.1 DUF4595 domain-containing protein [Candidatus Amulumruptor caecigallinarius]MCM1453799.1 DUF4595 domain-containing protein [bacterium]
MNTSLLRILTAAAVSVSLLTIATSCSNDDDNNDTTFLPQPPVTPNTPQGPAGVNDFARYGELTVLKYGLCNGDWSYGELHENYAYTFNADHLVDCVISVSTGVHNPIIYGDDKITVQHCGLGDVVEDEYVYFLENGRITHCTRNGKEMYRWEYDADGRVVRAVSLLTGGGIANAWRARWTATGDLAEVVCEEVSDYAAGRENFGDRVSFTYTTMPMLNPIAIKLPLNKPSTSTMLSLKLTPVLLAQGYYGNSVPAMLPSSISEYDVSESATLPAKVTDYRYTFDADGRVTRTEEMYTNGVGATNYYYGSCQTYEWR